METVNEILKFKMYMILTWFAVGGIGGIVIAIRNWNSKPSFSLTVVTLFAIIDIANVAETIRAFISGGTLSYGSSPTMTTLIISIGIISPFLVLKYRAVVAQFKPLALLQKVFTDGQ